MMSKWQVTIPKDVRNILGIESGARVTFIVENGTVRIVNSAVYAMQVLQNHMVGESKEANLETEEDVMNMVSELRTCCN